MSTLFSKRIGSSVFHLLGKDNIYKITCPRFSVKSSKDGEDFIFSYLKGDEESQKVIAVSRTVLCSDYGDEFLSLSLLRLLKNMINEDKQVESLHTGNIGQLLEDKYKDTTDLNLRTQMIGFILKRYEIDFETPYSVIEIAISLETTIDRTVRSLHYLHKHEMVSFNWSPEIWHEKSSIYDWLTGEFNISKSNLLNLKSTYSSNDNYPTQSEEQEYDYFICHASEDKMKVVEPLVRALTKKGFKVWYDKWEMGIGDRLSQKIDQGLLKSKFGIVVISKSFFKKEWPKTELSGLAQKEIGGHKVILPIWHGVDREFVISKSPLLADRIAGSTSDGIDNLVDKIIAASDNENSKAKFW